jgi:hypothetical protein
MVKRSEIRGIALAAGIFLFAGVASAAQCDGNKSQVNKKSGITFTSCYKSVDASATKNLFEITGSHKGRNLGFVINAADLNVAEGACEIPCEEMDNPDSVKCTGKCSYGWPVFLGFDGGRDDVFFYTSNSGGDTQNFSVFKMNLKNKEPFLVGKSSAAKLVYVKSDGKKVSFRAVQFKQAVKDATIEQLDVK